MKYHVFSSVPDAGGRNVTNLEEKCKFKITTLSEYIESEVEHLQRKLEILGCSGEKSAALLALLEETLKTADMPCE